MLGLLTSTYRTAPRIALAALYAGLAFFLLGDQPAGAAESLDSRLEKFEEHLGRHGISHRTVPLEEIRTQAADRDLPLLEARARLILGRSQLGKEGQAHLELAAEGFAREEAPGWEALARLEIARNLQRNHIKDALWSSAFRNEAVGNLRAAIELARRADGPLTEAEAHWTLASIYRLEDLLGPAVEHFGLAVDGFERARLPLAATAAAVELARISLETDQTSRAASLLEAGLVRVETGADVEQLEALTEQLTAGAPKRSRAKTMALTAKKLRERGHSDLAEYYQSLAKFFRENPGRITAEGQQELARIQAQVRRQRRQQRTEGLSIRSIPLLTYIEDSPDRRYVERALRIAAERAIEETDQRLRYLRLNLSLDGGSEPQNSLEVREKFLAHARETGTMPDLPVEWMVEQLERAPERYRKDPRSLVQWVELKAAEIYARLSREVEGDFGIPEEQHESNIYYPRNAWQLRYCQSLEVAFDRFDASEYYQCDVRPNLARIAERFDNDATFAASEVSIHTDQTRLRDQRRRLAGILRDPSRLEREVEEGKLANFLDLLFYDERNPFMTETFGSFFSSPEDEEVIREISRELIPARTRDLASQRDEVECKLAYQVALRERLAEVYQGVEHRAEQHRRWIKDFQEAVRRRFPPQALVSSGSSEPQAHWGVDCANHSNPSLVDLGRVHDALIAPSTPPDETLERAWADLEEGRPRQAIDTLRAYRDIGIDRPETRAWTLRGLGRAYQQLGETEPAIQAYRDAVAALESVLGSFQDPGGTAAYAQRVSEVYEELMGLLIAADRPAEAFEVAERARARAFLQQLGSRPLAATGTGSQEFLRTEQELRSEILRLQNLEANPQLALESPEGEPQTDRQNGLQTARARLQELREEVDLSAGAEEIRRGLPPETVLVNYYSLPDRTLVWTLDRNSLHLEAIPTGVKDLTEMVTTLWLQINNLDAYRETAAQLYSILIDPIASRVKGRSIYLVPHGPLHHLPFAALWNSTTKKHLVEESIWATLPSATVLRFLDAPSDAAPSRPLILGDPEGELVSARQEARTVAEIFGVEPLLGQEAAEGTLRRRVRDADLLHIAAHASLHQDDPLFSSIRLAPTNEPVPDSDDDGRLQLSEIRALDLANLDLVTLTACSTAAGERSRGDDVASLQRAFLESGAARVVSTLWDVQDEASAVLSVALYRRIERGQSVAEALRGAQQDVLAQEPRQHPFFWAGFEASGALW